MQNKQVYDELFDSAYVKVVTTEFFLSFMLIDDIPNTPVLNKQQIPIQICQMHKPSYNAIIFLRTKNSMKNMGNFFHRFSTIIFLIFLFFDDHSFGWNIFSF